MDLVFYMCVCACKKNVTGKQPYGGVLREIWYHKYRIPVYHDQNIGKNRHVVRF